MRENLERRAFVMALLLVTLAFIWLLKPFFTPIFWACVIALIFYPVQRSLFGRFPRHRNLMALLTLLLCVFAAVLPALLIVGTFMREALEFHRHLQGGKIDLSEVMEQWRGSFPGAGALVKEAGIDLEQLRRQLQGGLMTAGGFLAKHALALGQNTARFLLDFGLMLYLAFFLIRDGEALVALLIRALPLGDERERLLLAKFAEVTRATVKGHLVVAVTQGTLGGLTFWILGLPAPLFWGTAMTALAILPAIGAALIWLPAAVYLYATGALFKAAALMVFGLGVIALVDNALRPLLVGRDTKLPNYLVLFSTVGGLMMFGLSGFAMGPLLAALFMAFWQIFVCDFNSGNIISKTSPARSAP